MTPTTSFIESDSQPIVSNKIWVVDPRSGERVDVTAFVKMLHDFEPGYEANLNQGALDSIKRILQFLSFIVHDPVTTDFVQLSNIFNDLWRIWDMFEATNTVNIQPALTGSEVALAADSES